jgi:hypothetical protein
VAGVPSILSLTSLQEEKRKVNENVSDDEIDLLTMSDYLLNLGFIRPYRWTEPNVPNSPPTPAHIFINIPVLNRFLPLLFAFKSPLIFRSFSQLLSSKLKRQATVHE